MPNALHKKKEEQKQSFLDYIPTYQFISKEGRLDLEEFCVYLSMCFNADDIPEMSPELVDIYNLLLEHIFTRSTEKDASSWVQYQNISDWQPEDAYTYPDKRRTLIHISALVQYMPDWIYEIGHRLMKIPEPKESAKYFSWVQKDWVFLHTYINSFHNYYTNFLKEFDRKLIDKNGVSSFEALHTSTNTDKSYDEVYLELKKRNDAHKNALLRISEAMKAGFYLEAITLQECLISNSLFNFAQAKHKKLNNPTFIKLINEVKSIVSSVSPNISEFLTEIDQWRKKRNDAIHGFIATKNTQLNESQKAFDELSNKTASQGLKLCEQTVQWYKDESVNFVATEFKDDTKKALH